jgi:hypothetical protein
VATTVATLAVCLAVCGGNPAATVSTERVDLMEVNHFHDDQGRPVFDQIIFYDWSSTDHRYQIRDWRLLKNANQVPLRRTSDGEYVAVWTDFKNRDVLRTTQAKLVRETWTQYDPELIEREYLPEGKRRKLRETPTLAKLYASSDAPGTGGNSATALRPVQSPTRR